MRPRGPLASSGQVFYYHPAHQFLRCTQNDIAKVGGRKEFETGPAHRGYQVAENDSRLGEWAEGSN